MSKHDDIVGILSPAEIDACADTAEMRASATVKDLVHAVAQASAVPAAAIYGRSREPHVARARQIVMLAAHERGIKLASIGRALARDHATVSHGIAAERARRAQR